MTDLEIWNRAVAIVSDEFSVLPPAATGRLRELLGRVKTAKRNVHAFADNMQSSLICTSCGGECCTTGKHHFTIIDLLAYLNDSRQLFLPRFDNGLCPYLGENGCFMEPDYRPFNCVTFNCERVGGLLESPENEGFTAAENELRRCYQELEKLFDNRFMNGLLINYERDRQLNLPILRGIALR